MQYLLKLMLPSLLLLTACGVDADGDGYKSNFDCDDASAAVYPYAPETCNGVDDDCDGVSDNLGASGSIEQFRDGDRDGYGDPAASKPSCEVLNGYVTNNTDCDDDSAQVNPAAAETCGNAVDNDCDGTVDEGC